MARHVAHFVGLIVSAVFISLSGLLDDMNMWQGISFFVGMNTLISAWIAYEKGQ